MQDIIDRISLSNLLLDKLLFISKCDANPDVQLSIENNITKIALQKLSI